jgi:glycosyltransferase involved in cell wall biosynthesis
MTRRKKILFLFPFSSLGGGGGAQRVLATLLRHLDHRRFELHLVLLRAKRGEGDGIPAGVVVHNLDYSRVRFSMLALIRLVRRLRPDAVLSTVGQMNAALLLCQPWLPEECRLLIGESTTVSAYLEQTARFPRLWYALYRWLYKRADKVICLSDAMKTELNEVFSVSRDKLIRIYNPLDLEEIRSSAELGGNPFTDSGPHLVAAGRFVREKGIDLLLDAMPDVLSCLPQAKLTLLGQGPLEDHLKRLTQSLSIQHAVIFAGFEHNPWRHFRWADVVIVPSRVDGLPYVPLEALALGTSVVATDCPGAIREVAEGEGGILLVPPENTKALAEGILSVLKQPAVHRRPAQLCKFDLQHAVDEYSRLFEQPALE